MRLNENPHILKHVAHQLLTKFTHAEEDKFEEQAIRRPYTLELKLHDPEPLFTFKLRGPMDRGELKPATERFKKIAKGIFEQDEIMACQLLPVAVTPVAATFMLALK